MRNISKAKIIFTTLVLCLLFLAGCTQPAASNTPPVSSGEPQLSIGGDELSDTSVFETSTSSDDDEPAEETESEEVVEETEDNEPTEESEESAEETEDTEETEEVVEETESEDVVEETENDEPVVQRPSDIPTKRVNEGERVSFDNLAAVDPDGDSVTFTFSPPLNARGVWQTERGDAGEYEVTITASDGENTATQNVLIIVDSVNTAPTIGITSFSVNEGDTITLDPQAEDAEGDELSLHLTGWMTAPTKRTTEDDIGTHDVSITVSDGFEEVSKDIEITVLDVNHAPEISTIAGFSVEEGQLVRINPSATDADGDTLTYTFSEPLDELGKWQTQIGDEGQYSILVTVSDGEHEDSTEVDIEVLHKNTPPTLTLEDDSITVSEGETVLIKYETDDAEGDTVAVEITGWITSTSYTTTYDDAGVYQVTLTASDGKDETSKAVTVTVEDVNRAPVFDKNSFS